MEGDKLEKNGDLSVKIHNVRFYNLKARAIKCLDYNKIWKKLAISRDDGSIEIWNMQYAPFLEKTIPQVSGVLAESVVWAGERLFTAGLDAEVIEWNLNTLKPERKQSVTGNAIWCLAINSVGNELAVGTEEGYITILNINNDEMEYKNLFDKQEGRVICCKFDATGKYLVTGSIGAIRIWDVLTGHALHKMTIVRAQKYKEVIVWSLQVLRDFTIVAGDSLGQITVWDGRNGASIESHQVLKADVLVVTVNEQEDMVICSGVEPIIRIYAKTHIKREDVIIYRWVKYLQRNVHSRDVTALACIDDNIYSGSIDGYLGVSSISKMRSSLRTYAPFLQNPCSFVCDKARLVLFRYINYLEVWRLGSTTGRSTIHVRDELPGSNSKTDIQTMKSIRLAIDTGPELLLQLKSHNNDTIVCATLSPNGEWLCYSTQQQIRLFKFSAADVGSNGTQIFRIQVNHEQFTAASHIRFTEDSERLFIINANTKEILVYAIVEDGSDLDLVQSFDITKHISGIITIFTVSHCGTYVAVADTEHKIGVWAISKRKQFRHLLNLPTYTASATALAIHQRIPRLVAAYADGRIVEYDLENQKFTCCSSDYMESNDRSCIMNILLVPQNPNIFIVQDNEHLFSLKRRLPDNSKSDTVIVAGKTNRKKSKRKESINEKSELIPLFQKSLEHIAQVSWLNGNELVAVGVTPYNLVDELPGALKQKKFAAA